MRQEIHKIIIICDVCGKEIIGTKPNDKGEIKLILHDEEFTKYDDVCGNCYHMIWKGVYTAIKRIRGE